MPSKERLYIKVFNQISALIKEGDFAVGSRLPTERELAERFGVSRPTIREAITALEAREQVSVKVGSGVYVLGNKLITEDFGREISAFELLEARVLLEGESAALAAQMINPDELGALEEALKLIEAEDDNDDRSGDGDRRFHSIIAQATHNRIIAKQIHFLWDIQENLDHIKAAHQSVCITARESRLENHRQIYHAIKTGDADTAREQMRLHFKDLLQALHDATERQAVEEVQRKVSEMRERFSMDHLVS